ncbi:MAG: guanylate kinase [Bacteroidetes Order II. Incertae sedis bacterium]|nr:guanylate kinase [Bacteroidetes Order II. bacterium]
MKIVVLAAPSGSGKTTIAKALLAQFPLMRFSVSATTRERRSYEQDGRDYFYLNEADFRAKIAAGAFVEYEEVYPGLFYGTLRSEIERIATSGIALLDIDVEGAQNVKTLYGDHALTLFIKPPSLEALRERLVARGTETAESLERRLKKAAYEMSFADKCDVVILNDDLNMAVAEAMAHVHQFLARKAAKTS